MVLYILADLISFLEIQRLQLAGSSSTVFAVNLILYYARQAFLMILREMTLCVLDPPYGYLRMSISSRVFKITFQRNRRFRGGSRIFF